MFSGTIENCYDSHVHWQATGALHQRLRLHELNSTKDIQLLMPTPNHYLGDWLVGFGWDQTNFQNPTEIHRKNLDLVFKEKPVVFSRIDGHAYWVNTAALRVAGLYHKFTSPHVEGGLIELDADGLPTGVFVDRAMQLIRRHMPKPTVTQVHSRLLEGQKIFHKAGFTHIRDLTCDETQWEAFTKLAANRELFLAVEQLISCEDPEKFHDRLSFACYAREHVPSNLMRLQGVKVYFDGALGSEGALLSCGYRGTNQKGLQLISESMLSEMLQLTLENNLDLAVHVIGDEAAHKVARLAAEYWLPKNATGPTLHLEHGELLRPESIALLKEVKVHIHMQPCHWLSDKRWLKEKIGPLMPHVFRWHDLEEAGIPFDFGSDAPIEESSLQRNFLAIDDAALQGVQPIVCPERFHSHPDKLWTPKTWTRFENGVPAEMSFLQKKITSQT